MGPEAATTITEDAIYNKTTKVFIKYLGSASSYQIPDGLTIVGADAFRGNTTLQSVDLNGVTRLSDYSFADCTALKSIDLPNLSTTASYQGTYTFSNCTALTSVTFPAKVTNVNTGLFQGCTALKTFDFSAITTIKDHAFEGSG